VVFLLEQYPLKQNQPFWTIHIQKPLRTMSLHCRQNSAVAIAKASRPIPALSESTAEFRPQTKWSHLKPIDDKKSCFNGM
jgi:hypothetical protein